MKNRNVFSVSLLAFVALVAAIGIFINKEVQALPSQETYYTYYWNEAMTQYAGEELILGCTGRRNVMLNGQRAYYYVITSAPCDAGGGNTKSCEKCNWYRSYPYNPVCDSPVGMLCPPYVIGY
jgi:hypothetical protein